MTPAAHTALATATRSGGPTESGPGLKPTPVPVGPSPWRRLLELVSHPWLTVRAQIALGLFFVIAALPKIIDPPGFAQMIYNYRLLPGHLVNPMALVLPWFELLLGLALILGIWRQTANTVIGALLLVFIVAIGVNLARGNAIDCGCFDVTTAGRSVAERFRDMWMVIVRDLGMLVLVAQGLLADRPDPTTPA